MFYFRKSSALYPIPKTDLNDVKVFKVLNDLNDLE